MTNTPTDYSTLEAQEAFSSGISEQDKALILAQYNEIALKMDSIIDGERIQSTYNFLRSQSENFMSPDDIKEALEKLGRYLDKTITISDTEMSRMTGLFARMFPQEEVTRMIGAYSAGVEEHKAPMIVPLPNTITLDGAETPFSLRTLSALLSKKGRYAKQVRYHKEYVTDEQSNTTFGDNLRVTTSANLEGTKDAKYPDQLNKQNKWAKDNNLSDISIDVRAYLEMCMLHLRNPRAGTLIRYDIMRLNATGVDGDPLEMLSHDTDMSLRQSDTFADGRSGIGASSSLLRS